MESIKRIAIFGGTGMTGLCSLEEALNRGLKVKLLLRDPSRLPIRYHDKVEIIQGNVISLEDVEKVIKDVDGIVVALGTRNNLAPTTEMSTGMNNIIEAMKKNNLSIPVSVCLSSFLFWEPGKVPEIFKHINAEHERMLKALESSNLKYVAVFSPRIEDYSKAEYVIEHGKSPSGHIVSKYELGEFLVSSLEKSEHYCKRVGICSLLPK